MLGLKIVSSSELSAMNVSFLQHFMVHIMGCFPIQVKAHQKIPLFLG